MKHIYQLALLMFILVAATSAMAQALPDPYNPFVPANLDDPVKVDDTKSVVRTSFHYYSVNGDANYGTEVSTFVWYVYGGMLVSYDPSDGNWLALDVADTVQGKTINGVINSSEVWVRWDDAAPASGYGYVAVYEISPNGCIVDQKITGYKHFLADPPEAWFSYDELTECAEQPYSVDINFKNLFDGSKPYKLSYSHPNEAGTSVVDTLVIDDLSTLTLVDATTGSYTYTLDLNLVHENSNPSLDGTFTIKLEKLIDSFGSTGKIAPLGPTAQYESITLTVTHLPQTNKMEME